MLIILCNVQVMANLHLSKYQFLSDLTVAIDLK